MVSCFLLHLTYIYIYVIINRQGRHNIRIGIVWAQTGHSTGTCTAALCVIELGTHQKFESFKKKISATTKFEFESAS